LAIGERKTLKSATVKLQCHVHVQGQFSNQNQSPNQDQEVLSNDGHLQGVVAGVDLDQEHVVQSRSTDRIHGQDHHLEVGQDLEEEDLGHRVSHLCPIENVMLGTRMHHHLQNVLGCSV